MRAPNIDDVDDVRVVQASGDSCLALHGLYEVGVAAQMLMQNLQREQAIEAAFAARAAEIHRAHASGGHARYQFVASKALTVGG